MKRSAETRLESSLYFFTSADDKEAECTPQAGSQAYV